MKVNVGNGKTKMKDYILEVSIVFSIIACSSHALLTYSLEYSLIALLYLGCFILFMGLNHLPNFKINIGSKEFIVFGLVTIILFSLAINQQQNHILFYLRIITIIIVAYLISSNISFTDFVNKYVSYLTLFSLISLVMYAYVNVFKGTLDWPIFINSNGVSYYNGVIHFVLVHAPERNTGPFWEPGIFSTFIIIGLVFELFIKSKTDWRIVTVLLITNFTTYSTASYLLLLILLLIFFNQIKSSILRVIMNVFGILFFAIFWMFKDKILNFLYNLLPNVFGKVVESNGSVSTRTMGPLLDLKIFWDTNGIGTGFGGYLTEWSRFAFDYGVLNQTSTITYFLASLGMGGVIYLILVLKGIYSIKYFNHTQKIYLVLFFYIILTKEPHQTNLLMYIILFYFVGKETYVFREENFKLSKI